MSQPINIITSSSESKSSPKYYCKNCILKKFNSNNSQTSSSHLEQQQQEKEEDFFNCLIGSPPLQSLNSCDCCVLNLNLEDFNKLNYQPPTNYIFENNNSQFKNSQFDLSTQSLPSSFQLENFIESESKEQDLIFEMDPPFDNHRNIRRRQTVSVPDSENNDIFYENMFKSLSNIPGLLSQSNSIAPMNDSRNLNSTDCIDGSTISQNNDDGVDDQDNGDGEDGDGEDEDDEGNEDEDDVFDNNSLDLSQNLDDSINLIDNNPNVYVLNDDDLSRIRRSSIQLIEISNDFHNSFSNYEFIDAMNPGQRNNINNNEQKKFKIKSIFKKSSLNLIINLTKSILNKLLICFRHCYQKLSNLYPNQFRWRINVRN